MVSSLLAGIPLSWWLRTGMPRLLTRGENAAHIGYTVAGFISEQVAGFNRNPHVKPIHLPRRSG
jgi:hypothetical protein